jgi:hypothetical protein
MKMNCIVRVVAFCGLASVLAAGGLGCSQNSGRSSPEEAKAFKGSGLTPQQMQGLNALMRQRLAALPRHPPVMPHGGTAR